MPIINRGGGGGGPAGPSWVQKYECDFSDASPASCDWLGAGNQTYPNINGVGWGACGGGGVGGNNALAELQNFASALNYSSGTGIEITTANNSSDYNGDDQRAPRVVALVSDLIPGFSYGDTVCFQATGNCTVDPMAVPNGSWSDKAGFGLAVGRWTGYSYNSPYKANTAITHTFAQKGLGPMAKLRCGTSTKENYNTSANYTFFEIILYPNMALAKTAAGFWSGSFPEPGTTALTGVGPTQPVKGPDPSQIPSQLNLQIANTYVGMFALGGGGGLGETFNFTKFRALRLE